MLTLATRARIAGEVEGIMAISRIRTKLDTEHQQPNPLVKLGRIMLNTECPLDMESVKALAPCWDTVAISDGLTDPSEIALFTRHAAWGFYVHIMEVTVGEALAAAPETY